MKAPARAIAAITISLLAGSGNPASAADKPGWTASQLKSLNFRCTVADGPKLTDCKPLDAEHIDPRTVEYSRTAVESLPSCTLSHMKPGRQVTYPFPYSNDPAYLENPIQPHIITNPDYAEPPPLKEIKRLYPQQARRTGITGRAVIACTVDVDGKAKGCQVAEEEPKGYGFGEAGLAALQAFRFKPQFHDCAPTDQGTIRIPLVFAPSLQLPIQTP